MNSEHTDLNRFDPEREMKSHENFQLEESEANVHTHQEPLKSLSPTTPCIK